MLRHLSYNRLLMYEILLLVDNQPIYGFMITQNGEGRTSNWLTTVFPEMCSVNSKKASTCNTLSPEIQAVITCRHP